METETYPAPKRSAMVWVGWVLSVLPCLLLLMSAFTKIARAEVAVQGFADQGWPEGVLVPLGITELVSTVLYLIPQTAVLGAILLTGYMGGAIATHVRLAEPIYVQTLIGVVIWLGLFLRESRLRKLLPWRNQVS